MGQAVGFVECDNIARGYGITDVMLKAAAVQVLRAGAICPGRFLTIIAGDAAGVSAALEQGVESGGECILSRGMLANIDEAVLAVMLEPRVIPAGAALGLVETLTIAAAIVGADAAAKAAGVSLLDVRITRGMGGKCLVVFAGEVSAVQEAVDQVESRVAAEDLVSCVALPAPHPQILAQW